MSIKILTEENKIILKTKNTMYVMEMLHGRFPVHLYYGKNTKNTDFNFDNNYRSFSPYYEEYGKSFSPDTAPLEFSFFGYGDFRSSALKIFNSSSGSDITDFIFRKAKKFRGRKEISGLPYAEGASETLELIFDDAVTKSELHLYYTLFNDCDVISRYFTLKNKGKNDIRIEKCMSLSLDIQNKECDLISFQSKYFYERHVCREPLYQGNRRITSRRGSSSHHANPFFVIADRKATEEKGEAYGFNFVYSGSYLNEIEVDQNGTVRAMVGLGDECFNYLLCADEEFTSPEAIMTYSAKGIGEISRNMHSFVRSHILPADVFAKRPVVLNSWEAFHFDIDEETMVNFAKSAVECGMDMVVMDDGWFGSRRNDKAGLGDWTPSHELFKNGLRAFVDRVRSTGVKFGIWIEPEMVNPDSDLYRAHPDWVLCADGREKLLSRNQLVLDMANPEVIEYLKASFDKCFEGVNIDYFKWDMNRNMSHPESPYLPAERKRESSYRYMLGVYEFFRWLRERFPNAMIENCSGGGGRYDLGMMKYSTQIWTSDNTNPQDRIKIQYGSSFGYPASVMSCHVANRNSEISDPKLLEFGFRVALNGPLGYELNIINADASVKNTMKDQIKEYRKYEDLIMNGEFYRLKSPFEDGCYAYYFVKKDNSEILLSYLQSESDKKERVHRLKISRAIRGVIYRDNLSGLEISGNELRKGITIKADKDGKYAKMFHFTLYGSGLKY
ncbi:MAG: alpha-galactosidase [Ruminococcaceae bacterium]|nr:alpha-galactosidase [Oscillospiraceae bacterium]